MKKLKGIRPVGKTPVYFGRQGCAVGAFRDQLGTTSLFGITMGGGE